MTSTYIQNVLATCLAAPGTSFAHDERRQAPEKYVTTYRYINLVSLPHQQLAHLTLDTSRTPRRDPTMMSSCRSASLLDTLSTHHGRVSTKTLKCDGALSACRFEKRQSCLKRVCSIGVVITHIPES